MRDKLEEFMAESPCPVCKGRRLKNEVLSVLVGGKNIIDVTDLSINGRKKYRAHFEGVVTNISRRYQETKSEYMRDKLEEFMAESPCPVCKGRRLKNEVLSVLVGGKNIIEVTDLSINELIEFIDGLNDTFSEKQKMIAAEIIKEIKARASFLRDVGLDYLNLSWKAGTLSGV